jgi:hypothetical protein
MEVLLERCAGVDVGKDEVVACVRAPGPGGKGRRKQTRTFLSLTGGSMRWSSGSRPRA